METVKERPVLFSTAMMIALLAGRKTMTRRVRRLGDVGDVLWVRETFAFHNDGNGGKYPVFKASGGFCCAWKPSIFMPKDICRLRLKLTAVYQEHLQDISDCDAIKEGGVFTDNGNDRWGNRLNGWSHVGETQSDKCLGSAKYSFGNLWEQINGIGSWDSNPLVWVHEFEIIKK